MARKLKARVRGKGEILTPLTQPVYTMERLLEGLEWLRKNRLARAAAKVGGAIGKADRKAHQIVAAGAVAKQELHAIAKKVDALKRQLEITAKRLQRAVR